MKKRIGLLAPITVISLILTLGLGSTGAAPLKGSLSLVGSTSIQPLAEELAKAFMELNPGVKVTVAGGGSGAGVKAAANGQADIGMASREVKPEELSLGLNPIVIARDGIAVIINRSNRVSNLTLRQIADIYNGKINNWKDVGGTNAPIILIGREAGSGTRGAFEELVLHPFKLDVSPTMMQQGSTGTVRQIVSVTRYAIGYISMGQIDKSIKPLQVNKVQPTAANVLNGTYVISRPFNLITKGTPQGPAKAFLDYVMSPRGQAIVAEEFVPVGKTE